MMQVKLLATAGPFQGDSGLYFFDDESLAKWIEEGKSAHKDRLEEAGDIGHTAHAWIEALIKAILSDNESRKLELLAQLPEDERAANCCTAALTWMERHAIKWISTERKVYSREYKYAGTLDGLCRASSCDDPTCCPVSFIDRLTLVDWKTSNYLYLEFKLQTEAYRRAYIEEHNEIVEDVWILRLGKETAEFDPWHLTETEFDDNWEGFKAALRLSRAVAIIKERLHVAHDTRKAKERTAEKTKREAELKIKCAKADKFKGTRYPKCNGGDPCETCLAKFKERHPDYEKELTTVE